MIDRGGINFLSRKRPSSAYRNESVIIRPEPPITRLITEEHLSRPTTRRPDCGKQEFTVYDSPSLEVEEEGDPRTAH